MFQVYFANKPIICLAYQVCDRLAAKHTQMPHLSILSMKAMPGHVERIAPSTHDSSIQIRLKFSHITFIHLKQWWVPASLSDLVVNLSNLSMYSILQLYHIHIHEISLLYYSHITFIHIEYYCYITVIAHSYTWNIIVIWQSYHIHTPEI